MGTFSSGFLPRQGFLLLFVILSAIVISNLAADDLDQGWERTPRDARVRAYWWWLNGNVTGEAITRDLEEMKAKGFGGALICDAGGAEQRGNDRVPHGPTFGTPEWRELFKHTMREAERLDMELSLSIMSGWNLGGPMVKPEDASKKLVYSETVVQGPVRWEKALPAPKTRDGFYRDLFVLAWRGKSSDRATNRPRPLQRWEQKALHKAMSFSAPDTSPLLQDVPAEPGEEDTDSAGVLDLSARLGKDGTLTWDVPEGRWEILRFGSTIGDHAYVSTCSDGWQGYAVDALDQPAFQRYWDAVVEPLLADAKPWIGRTLKYLHTDSWEVEAVNWTPTLREEFSRRRGYDMLPYFPVIAGRIVNSRSASNRFLHDFRRTIGDMAAENHYGSFLRNARRHNLLIHPESGGPHAVPIDAQQCLGAVDTPMSEFWAWSWEHRIGDSNRFFMKQPASAAHVYGRKFIAGEGFTTIGPHWQETVWDNLKPAFDKALTEGLNRLVWHAMVCNPKEMGIPGQQYFAGTHFNPDTTWWSKSAPFLSYINRSQWMLQQGLFVADVAYYYGDHVPNFTQLKSSDPAKILPGYDYDVMTAEAILQRLSVQDGRLVLPDGMSYRLLVLPDRTIISLPVLRRLKELAAAGAIILGPKPTQASGLSGYPQSDSEVANLADELWGPEGGDASPERPFGKGSIVPGLPARRYLKGKNIRPDFDFSGAKPNASIDYIHRRRDETEIYFIANRSDRTEDLDCYFRVTGKAPELWDAVSGKRSFAAAYRQTDGQTIVPLEFSPNGSWFVVFREAADKHPATKRSNSPLFQPGMEIGGAWDVHFDPKWGGPAEARFDDLIAWNAHAEPGIKYYSGTAVYRKSFPAPAERQRKGQRIWLDLGNLRELAEVRLNGKDLGIVWMPPFRIDITAALQAGSNRLEVEVVNFWPNRIIGDQFLQEDKRYTRTNIRKLTRESKLMESGLLGPVRLVYGFEE